MIQSTPPTESIAFPVGSEEARKARRRVSPGSRKRIANACLACKSRKQKCDGQRPCNICQRRAVECVYAEQPLRPAKRQRRWEETAAGPATRGCISRWGNSLPGLSGGAGSPQDGTPRGSDGVYGVAALGSGADAEGRQNEDDERVEAPIEHRARMLSDSNGRLLYIGETGSVSFLARVRKLVKDTLGQSSFTLDSAQNSIADRPLARNTERPGAPAPLSIIPSSQDSVELVNLYFSYANATHYVLEREEMDRILGNIEKSTQAIPVTGDRNRDAAVLNAVCAIGCFFTEVPQLSAGKGIQYFDNAKSLMEDVFESADFWSVRLLLLFAIFMHYAAKKNSAWVYIGLAVRIAQSVGLHHTSAAEHGSEVASEDIMNQRKRRLVFWTLYSLDRFTGCSLGRPYMISDEICTDPVFSPDVPSNDCLIGSLCLSGQPATVHQTHRAAAGARLHAIIGHISKAVYLRRSISRDVAETLSNRLRQWYRSIPSCCSLNVATDQAIVQLHMAYLHAIALLTRPFLQRVIEDSIEESIKDRRRCQCNQRSDTRSNVKRKMLRYAGACVLVAERTVALARGMKKQGNLPRNDGTVIYYLFTSGLILLFSALPQVICTREDHHPAVAAANPSSSSPAPSPIDLQTRSQPIIALLAECAQIETCAAKRYHTILYQFAAALKDYQERRLREESERRRRGDPDGASVNKPPPELDLLDELQTMDAEYASFASQKSRGVSPRGEDEVAAHALVAVASNTHTPLQTYAHSPHPQYYMQEQQHEQYDGAASATHGLTDFSSFFGWLEEAQIAAGGVSSGDGADGGPFGESPPVPWEFSWDGPPSDFFATAAAIGGGE